MGVVNRLRLLIISFSALILVACSSTVVRGVADENFGEAFSLEARISVSHENERFSGRLSWRHALLLDELLLTSPFGQAVAAITIQPGRATLIASDQRRYEAPDVQVLMRDVLGYSLPVDRLSAWVLAKAGPTARVERDVRGRIVMLEEENWRIEYAYLDEQLPSSKAANLPASLTATRPGGPDLRLRIEEWNFE